MLVLEFLIDKDGLDIWPLDIPDLNNTSQTFNNPGLNVITLTFFNSIVTTTNPYSGAITNISPTNPVTEDITGTVTIMARPTPNSVFLNIENGTLDLSLNEVMLNVEGLISGIVAAPSGVTGCNYILCQLTRGA
jgi:hypothetical protein